MAWLAILLLPDESDQLEINVVLSGIDRLSNQSKGDGVRVMFKAGVADKHEKNIQCCGYETFAKVVIVIHLTLQSTCSMRYSIK